MCPPKEIKGTTAHCKCHSSVFLERGLLCSPHHLRGLHHVRPAFCCGDPDMRLDLCFSLFRIWAEDPLPPRHKMLWDLRSCEREDYVIQGRGNQHHSPTLHSHPSFLGLHGSSARKASWGLQVDTKSPLGKVFQPRA